MDSTRKEGHGVQCRPKATENGHVERGNPPSALSGEAGAGDQAVSLGGVGCPKKPMPGVMPRICRRRAGARDGIGTREGSGL
jgi:hypothetical protein